MTKIIAHRGASKYAPENTRASFELAYQMNADGIETDVQLSKDGIPVLFHDEKIKRTARKRGYIQEYTYNELKTMDVGSWFGNEYNGEFIMSLEEFLLWIADKPLLLHLELKNNQIDYPHLEILTYNLVERYGLLDRTFFSTFSTRSIQRLNKISTDTNIGWLTNKSRHQLPLFSRSLGANAIHIKYRLLQPKLVQQAKTENMPLRVYTVNKLKHIHLCFQYKCDSIFTDVPDVAKTIYQSYL
ncbi:glycerophosphodiester phosphodiesterase [Oceanobacillus kimchii]|uniref:glycerophosphodiester phosphodiesterase n=1 Tax=Oceanobacillus TaxID=182709 RepID=UPI00084E74AA|nr:MULTISPECIES: glycerophosphodiester phosphodiesterase family protein [Oceanobacillus]MCT1575972.1 glycerophosphodiester phosphodiesterase [Oceanobacillus kimchii]MCT2135609.1 glycerophosphodiester phosphodiesterase [Oceanobacillus kimchii]OEH55709.1 glycerophosphodiester phosphodiesterase [Oceanobacillus sp. E9]